MVFVYIKIYYAARDRARRNIKAKRKSRRKSARTQAVAAAKAKQQFLAQEQEKARKQKALEVAAIPPAPSSAPPMLSPAAPAAKVPTIAVSPGGTPANNGNNNNNVDLNRSPRQSAMKRSSLDSNVKAEKKTRFSFADDEVAAKSGSDRDEQSYLMKNGGVGGDGEDDDEDDFTDSDDDPSTEPKSAASGHAGNNKVVGKPKKKLVHILSAVSVSVNDSPLSMCDDTPSSVMDTPTPSSTQAVSPGPGHAYGACIGNGTRSRRSIGVSTRPDDSCSDNNNPSDKEGDKASTKGGGKKMRCLKLRSKFKGPLYGRRPSKETREMMDTGKTGNGKASIIVEKDPPTSIGGSSPGGSSSAGTESKTKTIMTRFQDKFRKKSKSRSESNGSISLATGFGRLDNKKQMTEAEAEREKKRMARKKERRATLILGLIMGSFILSWLPFFFLYSISPVCPICEESPDSACCIQGWGFSFAFWLGYSNSALNPVIYTIFNKDFRRAFKRILFK